MHILTILTTLVVLPKKKLARPHSHFQLKLHFKKYVFLGLVSLVAVVSLQLFQTRIPCANSVTCREPLGEFIDNTSSGIFLGQVVSPPKIEVTQETQLNNSSVLGETASENDKHIYIDLDQQTLYAYQNSDLVQASLVSTGRWGWTPVGNYHIQSKFRSTRMSGGSGNDYYNLPNVPYTMYFNGDFGIHGAYWHNNFGRPMSHGCVNMRTIDAKELFEWADGPQKNVKGTPVSVCQTFIAPDTCIQDKKVHMPTPSGLPSAFTVEVPERISPDGSKKVIMDIEDHADGTKTYSLSVLDTTKDSEELIMSQRLADSLNLSLPFNSWSPDNTYFFVEQKSDSGTVTDVQIFKASGTFPSGERMLTVVNTFSEKQPNYTFSHVTGWASNTLLIVNSWKPDMSKGPSFWYEVPSQAIVRLSQQF